MAFMESSCAYNFKNRGFAFHRQKAMTLTGNGKAHSTISPKRRFRRNIKYILPKVRNEVLTSPAQTGRRMSAPA